jgi:hypothetical protein
VPAALDQVRRIVAIPAHRIDLRLVRHLSAAEAHAVLEAPRRDSKSGIRDRAAPCRRTPPSLRPPRGVVAVVEPLSPRRRDRERPRLLHPGPCHGTHCLGLRRGYIARSRPGLPSMGGAHRGIRCSTTSDRVFGQRQA